MHTSTVGKNVLGRVTGTEMSPLLIHFYTLCCLLLTPTPPHILTYLSIALPQQVTVNKRVYMHTSKLITHKYQLTKITS